ncbi:MAG: hypothetical protein WBV22_11545 [Anaerolineaceae bacterium]
MNNPLLQGGEEVKKLATEMIVDHISRGEHEDDLILAICQKYDLRWEEVKKLVARVKEENAEKIALKQMPVKSILAVFIGVGGFALFLVSLLLLIDLTSLTHQILSFEELDLRELVLLRAFGPDMIMYFVQNITNIIPMAIFFMIQGLAMMIGSVIGMREYWEILIDRVGKALWK